MLRGFGTLVLSLEICLCSPHLGFVPLLKKSSSTGVDSLLNSHSLHTPAGLFPCALSPRIYKSHAAFLLPLRGAGDPGLDSDKTGKNLCARSSSLTSSSRLLGRVRMASSGAVPGQAHRATGDEVAEWKRRVLVISGPTGVRASTDLFCIPPLPCCPSILPSSLRPSGLHGLMAAHWRRSASRRLQKGW